MTPGADSGFLLRFVPKNSCSAFLLCAKLISHVVTSKRWAAQLPPHPYCPLGTAAGWIAVPERRGPLPNSRSSGNPVLAKAAGLLPGPPDPASSPDRRGTIVAGALVPAFRVERSAHRRYTQDLCPLAIARLSNCTGVGSRGADGQRFPRTYASSSPGW